MRGLSRCLFVKTQGQHPARGWHWVIVALPPFAHSVCPCHTARLFHRAVLCVAVGVSSLRPAPTLKWLSKPLGSPPQFAIFENCYSTSAAVAYSLCFRCQHDPCNPCNRVYIIATTQLQHEQPMLASFAKRGRVTFILVKHRKQSGPFASTGLKLPAFFRGNLWPQLWRARSADLLCARQNRKHVTNGVDIVDMLVGPH